MNPWLALGWMALAGVLLLIGVLLCLLGFLLGWNRYVAPAATALLIVLPLLVHGGLRLLRGSGKSAEQPDAGHEKTGLGKGPVFFSDTGMWETLKRQWAGVLAEAKAVPLFLVLGSSHPDMRALLGDALPLSRKTPVAAGDSSLLSLYMTDNAAWLIISPQVSGIALPSAGAGPPQQGLAWPGPLHKDGSGWDILLELLPSFPGPVAGAVVTLLPKELTEDGGAAPGLLGRRLAALRGRLKRRIPLWLIMDRMDQTPGGKAFCRALQPDGPGCCRSAGSDGALSLRSGEDAANAASAFTKPSVPQVEAQKPFGIVLDGVRGRFQPASGETKEPETVSGTYPRGIGDDFDRLVDSLGTLSAQYDSALLRASPFAGDVLLLRHSLQSYKAVFCGYADALMRNDGLRLVAVFLCGGAAPDGSGRIFARELFESFIPDCAEKFSGGIPYKKNVKAWALAANVISLVCMGLGITLVVGAWQANGVLNALEGGVSLLRPVSLEEQRAHDILPPLNRLHTITALLAEQETRCAGPAGLFKAPEKAVRDVKEKLSAHFIIPLLPTEDNKNERLALWTESLLDWSRVGVSSLPIQTSGGEILTRVDGGATAKGRQKAAEMLAQWERMLPEGNRVQIRWIQHAYDARVFELWQAAAQKILAAADYPDSDVPVSRPGGGKTPDVPSGVRMRDLIGAESLPLNFLDIASRELAFSRGNPGTPEWIAALHAVHDLRALSRLGGSGSGYLDGATAATATTVTPVTPVTTGERWRSIVELLPDATELLTPQRFELAFQNASAWGKYESALHALMPQATSRQGIMALAAGRYSGSEASLLAEVEESYKRLFNNLAVFAPVFISERALLTRRLVESPLKAVQTRGSDLAAGMLQDKWLLDVVDPLLKVNAADMEEVLFGENGSLKRFVDTVARPYLRVTSKGYAPASASGVLFPFTSEFIRFINGDGLEPVAHPKRFPLDLNILPVTANSDAAKYPRGVTVRLMCGDRKIVGGALNNRRSLSFVWSPESCDGLSLQVHFDDFSVVKEYPGPGGVVDFIYDAVNGGMTFTPDDFPASRGRLKAIGVTRIQPRFELNGGEAVISLLEDPGLPVPRRIIRESGRQ